MSLKTILETLLATKPRKEPSATGIVAEAAPDVPKAATLQSAADSILRSAVKASHSVVRVGFSKYGGIEIREVNEATGEVLARRPHGSARQTVADVLDRWRKGAK
jgi:hypothetical protein